MKIVLTLDEIMQIVGKHLISIGKLENKATDVHWYMDNADVRKSYVELEQIENIKEWF